MAPSKLRKKPVRTADKTKATAQQVTQQVTIPQASSPQVAIAAAPAVHTLATAPAAVQQQHVVQLKQSLQLVQSLLGVSFGTIAFLRDFFPEKAFTKVRFHLNTFPETYEAFSAATGPPAGDRSKNSFSVTRLQKGEEPAADRMLAWLEEGVFPMLEKRYLKALQLAVFNEEGALFEAYTFSFRYREEGGIDLNIDDGSNSNQITTTDATSNVTSMMRKLLNITRSLPHLPDTEKRLVLRVLCTEAAPEGYRPLGFPKETDAHLGALIMRETDTFQLAKHDGGVANTGYHAVSLRVSNLERIPTDSGRRRRGSRFQHNIEDDVAVPHISEILAQSSSQSDVNPNSSQNEGVRSGTLFEKQLLKQLVQSPGLSQDTQETVILSKRSSPYIARGDDSRAKRARQ